MDVNRTRKPEGAVDIFEASAGTENAIIYIKNRKHLVRTMWLFVKVKVKLICLRMASSTCRVGCIGSSTVGGCGSHGDYKEAVF